MSDHTHQTRAAVALLSILTAESLPDCQWLVYRELGLEGQIMTEGDDALYDLQVWAQKLGTGVQHDVNARIRYTSGTYARTPVRVFVQEYIPR